MGCNYFFDLDYYGVGFYEEVVNSEPEQMWAEAARPCRLGGPVSALHKLGRDFHLSLMGDDSYNRKNRNNTQKKNRESQQRKQKEPGNVSGEVPQPLNKRCIKRHTFTCGQLRELERVFQENQHPDVQKRKQLAELIDVDEHKVKSWFKNKRAKYKKNQEALLHSSETPSTQDHACVKIKMEPNAVSDLQKTVENGFIFCQQHLGSLCWP
ncbi:rhox homeobox family member 1-like [Nannospalax galili]|uniref:rhox homeobox family member 1-like n=1 Tax=Nannospalax galili TaxID=1026970 RepID=UPI0004ED1A26|nr:rhox homeobox family member 1-like [Nannospalax galili]